MSLAIQIDSLSKAYRIGQFNTGALSQDIERWWALFRGKEDPFLKIAEDNDRTQAGSSNIVWSLSDINLNVDQGDTVGIIGKNGAGKSTLLKVMSRVTSPTRGSIKIKGRVASLLEVGTGFHPELTGRENIFLNGAILGMRKYETKKHFDEIVDFAGVGRYIDTPVKRYSSGMYVRLAFAVAAHLDSEILIVDEVLAVGDSEFQKKCLGKMGDISRSEGRTILFVSHNMASVNKLCKTGILLANGQVKRQGDMSDIISAYLSENVNEITYKNDDTSKPINISEIEVKDAQGNQRADFKYDENIKIRIKLSMDNFIDGSSVFVMILDSAKRRVFAAEKFLNKDELIYEMEIAGKFLTRGSYSLHCLAHMPNKVLYDEVEDVCGFSIIDHNSELSIHGPYDYGSVFGNYQWNSPK